MPENDTLKHTTYEAEIQAWRQRMEQSLRAERGWLALAGLFWLENGENQFGAAGDNAIVLPGTSAPAHAGSFTLRDGVVTLLPSTDSITVNGEPATIARLRSDGDADLIAIGHLTMRLLRRGERYAIRLWDRRNPAREAFAGRRWYPIDAAYRLTARFIAHDPPRTLPVPNVLSEIEQRPSPGYAIFTLGGRERSLDAVIDGDELFFIFRDQTAGDTTYAAGRFLKAAYPEDGQITLDFNRAYSPPCAFTAFATCPLPPPGNHLPLRIEAGELDDHSHH